MTPLDGKRILLADDEPEVREIFRLLLEASHARVTVAANGATAWSLYKTGEFDCVVTDYSMPGMKGDALALAIKTANPAQRVVMISAYADAVLVRGRPPWFIDALVPKPPASMADFLEAINPPPRCPEHSRSG